MRWNKKVKIVNKEYDFRTVVKFAVFPIEIGNKVVWLERYLSHQTLRKVKRRIRESKISYYILDWVETGISFYKQK